MSFVLGKLPCATGLLSVSGSDENKYFCAKMFMCQHASTD